MANEPRFEIRETTTHTLTMSGEPLTKPSGEFHWHFRDSNGRITFTGGESFSRREDAERALKAAIEDVLTACGVAPTGQRLPVILHVGD